MIYLCFVFCRDRFYLVNQEILSILSAEPYVVGNVRYIAFAMTSHLRRSSKW